jgi:hypothetical protein
MAPIIFGGPAGLVLLWMPGHFVGGEIAKAVWGAMLNRYSISDVVTEI